MASKKFSLAGSRAGASPQTEAAKSTILKSVELHNRAESLIEDEVSRYREDLYIFAKSVANSEMEEDIITKSHVRQAKQILWRRRPKRIFTDVFLNLGVLLLGICIPLILGPMQPSAQPNLVLLALGIGGGILLGMGIIGKARQN